MYTKDEKQDKLFWLLMMGLAFSSLTYLFFSDQVLLRGEETMHLARIEGIREGLLCGQLPVRIHAFQFNGYGTPEGIFYPDIFLYPMAVMRMAGLGFGVVYNSYWLMVYLLVFWAGWYAYRLLSGSWGRGAMAAILYGTQFIFLWGLGNMMSSLAYGFMPLAFVSCYLILKGKDGARLWPWLVLATTAIIQSHVICTLLTVAGYLAICLCCHRGLLERDRRLALLKAAGLSMVLNLWRLVPFLYMYEKLDFRIKEPEVYHAGFNSLHLITSDWYNLLLAQCWLGIPVLVLLGFFLVYHRNRMGQERGFYLSAAGTLVLVAGVTEYFPWHAIELLPWLGGFLPKLQFSLRFVPLGMVPLAYYLGSYLVEMLLERRRCLAGMGAVCLAVCGATVWTLQENIDFYIGGNHLTNKIRYDAYAELPSYGGLEDYLYSDIWFRDMRNRQGQVPQPGDIYTEAEVTSFAKRGTSIDMAYRADRETAARLPLFYYPGYHAYLDGEGHEVPLLEGEQHLMHAVLPAGSHRVEIRYGGLWFFRAADWLSAAGLAVFLWLWYREGRRMP